MGPTVDTTWVSGKAAAGWAFTVLHAGFNTAGFREPAQLVNALMRQPQSRTR